MKLPRLTLSLFVLVPFLFSVSGILVIQTHCLCTGNLQVSLYLSPEACSDVMEEHNHLFAYHADDLNYCCDNHPSSSSCGQTQECHDCGCDSPEARFYQVDNQFMNEKVTISNLVVLKVLDEFLVTNQVFDERYTEELSYAWFKDPPPLRSSLDNYIYFICQTKIPAIA